VKEKNLEMGFELTCVHLLVGGSCSIARLLDWTFQVIVCISYIAYILNKMLCSTFGKKTNSWL
jgi:hypothetical protein